MAPLEGWKGHLYFGLVNGCLPFARAANVRLLKGHWPPLSLSPFQIVNGYFVHFFAPQGLPVVPKNVIFVIDVSGSMRGRKMDQVLSSVQAGGGGACGREREIFEKWTKLIFPVKEEKGGQDSKKAQIIRPFSCRWRGPHRQPRLGRHLLVCLSFSFPDKGCPPQNSGGCERG